MLKKLLSIFLTKNKKQSEYEVHVEFETACSKWLDKYAEVSADFDSLHKTIDNLPDIQGTGRMKDSIDELNEKLDEAVAHMREASEKTKHIAHYYQKFYPKYSFITHGMVNELCEKYNLHLGFMRDYLGELSDPNIVARDFFPEIDATDQIHGYLIDEVIYREGFYSWAEFIDLRPDRMVYDADCEGNYCEGELLKAKIGDGKKLLVSRRFAVLNPTFLICAPAADFKTHNDVKYDWKHKNLMSDPIILKPVKNGYLLVNMLGHRVGEMALKLEATQK